MGLLIRMAWRNIWRQKRRTLITVGAMAVGVAFSLAMIAISDGMYMMAFDLMVSENMGHVQVHHPDFPKQRAIYDSIDDGDDLVTQLEALPEVDAVSGRLYGFALLGTDDRPERPGKSAGAQLVGVDPARESALTQIQNKVQEGRYLADAAAHEIVLGFGIAETLGAQLGDEIVAVTQAADGSMGNDLYEVVGVFKTGSVIQDRAGVFLHIDDLRELLVLYGQVHEVALLAPDKESIGAMKGAVESATGEALLVRSWDQINPSIAQMLGFQDVGNGIILLMVFSVAALGILNTMLMSVFERTKELGVVRALGLRPRQMVALVMWETVALAGCAAILGLVLGLGMDVYLVQHGLDLSGLMSGDYSFAGANFPPIMMGAFRIEGVIQTIVGLFAVSMFAAIWPAIRAARLKPVVAMRQE